MNVLNKAANTVRKYGAIGTVKKVEQKLRHKIAKNKPVYSAEELERQKTVNFPRKLTFSIVVPLYNTPERFLREMIESVQAQTYAQWQLCMADGSDAEHEDVEKICKEYTESDARVCYRKLEHNLGISGNTNACIDMATGDYIALFDHDDLLHPAALYEMMVAICEQGADFIYTDEDLFVETPADAYSPHYKPDFAPDTLRSYNYICHFTAFSRELLEQVGGFRSAFDGSQDYDIILRLTERAKHIVHIPKILYYWRNHANSTASDVSAKPYTMVSAKKALSEHLKRVGLAGNVLDSTAPTTYRIAYEIEGNPLVSIVVYDIGDEVAVQRCVRSIRENTSYANWELIVAKDYETGAQKANGEYLLLVSGDTEVITADWVQELLMYAQRKDVGATGAMLYYPDDTVEHAGVIIGANGSAGLAHQHYLRANCGYKFRMGIAQNYSAVSSACMMIRRSYWDEFGGIDCNTYGNFLGGVDLCLRMREKGYLILWTPYAELYHHTKTQKEFSHKQSQAFTSKRSNMIAQGDPYYNQNLDLTFADFYTK